MAQKFLNLDEAAQTLGISKEKLNQLREDNRIHAYRDGAGWKFKVEEVDRVANEMRDGTFDNEDALDLDFLGGEDDSILLSEVELGDSENAPSTIIGNQDDIHGDGNAPLGGAGDSDLKLASESDLSLADESGLALAESGLSLADESDLTLASGDSGLALPEDDQPAASAGQSDVLASGDDQPTADLADTKGSGIGSHFDNLDELELDLESASSNDLPTTEPAASAADTTEPEEPQLTDLSGISIDVSGSGLSLAGDDEELSLASEQSGLQLDGGSEIVLDSGSSGLTLDGSDLLVTGDSSKDQADNLMSDVTLAPDESAIDLLADDDDDELVLGDAVGSDITLGSGDSGINLAPSDSGLSLDEAPLALGGSAVESLDLSDDEVLLEEDTDGEVATQLKTDEDFLLTPLDEGGVDAEDDSSQVIALDSESFDESAATMLGGGLLEDDLLDGGLDDGGAVGLEAAAPAGVAAADTGFVGAAAPAAAPSEAESPYTVWNLLSLTLCAMLLGLTGMMLFDLVRSVWSWNEPYAINSTLMDGLTQAIPIFE